MTFDNGNHLMVLKRLILKDDKVQQLLIIEGIMFMVGICNLDAYSLVN